jgi:hypothetical protein
MLTECNGSSTFYPHRHKDGWRSEPLLELANEPACDVALANLMTTIVTRDVPNKIANILSSATLIVLLKIDAAAMKALKHQQGPPSYIQL